MIKKNLSHVPTRILVLAAIAKLSGFRHHNELALKRPKLSVEATVRGIQLVLNRVYGRNLTRRHVERILRDLTWRGFIFKRTGLLKDGRTSLYAIQPNKIAQEAFTLIKIDSEMAYALDGSEGLLYDPPSLETLFGETNRWFPEYWDTELIVDLLNAVGRSLPTLARGAKIVSKELAKLE